MTPMPHDPFEFTFEFADTGLQATYGGVFILAPYEKAYARYADEVAQARFPNCALDLCDFVKAATLRANKVNAQLTLRARPPAP